MSNSAGASALLLCLVACDLAAQPFPAGLAPAPEPFPLRPGVGVVTFSGAIAEPALASLRGLGLDPFQFLPGGKYLVHGPQAAIAAAALLPGVISSAPLSPSVKLTAKLHSLAAMPVSASGSGPLELDVIIQLFDAGDLKALRTWLAAGGGREVSISRPARRVHLRAVVPTALLAALARWPSIYRVEEHPEIRLLNERALVAAGGAFSAGDLCVLPGHQDWLARKGGRGVGAVVHLMDDGIEQGNASGIPGTSHPDLLGAIAGVDNATSDPLADGRSGHGSLNASLLAGRGTSLVSDDQGFLLGLGMAPGATVYATKIFNNLGRFEVGGRSFSDLVSNASQRGASISSNSWGASVFGVYDALAVEFDALTRDANPDPGLQPMTFIFAAGNEGDDVPGGSGSVASPASAKNVVAVGATESCDAAARDGCGFAELDADSIRDVPLFSSRGPLDDGRLGPTVVAPATHMTGAASTAAGYDGSGLCDPYWPPGQVLYARGTGSSHACPLVAGGAALFQQWYADRHGAAPTPALVRATLAAGAQDLAGGNDGLGGQLGHAPDHLQGWGRLKLDEVIPDEGAAPRALYFDEDPLLTDAGDVWEAVVFPLDPARPVRIALAWSDPPAMPEASPALVNDLDLEVESDGAMYRGNVFVDGASVPLGEPDRLNNLEGVILSRPGAVIRLRVRAAAVNGDGAPAGDSTDQNFAVAVLGATQQSSRGVAAFRRPAFSCESTAGIVVTDLDLKGRASVQVTVSSSAAAPPVVATLTEATAGSGVFDGAVELGGGPGQLPAQDSGTLTARYLDADDGTGRATESVATARVDCAAPAISQLEVRELDETSAIIAWATSEDATGKLRAGTACGARTQEVVSPRRARVHTITLTGLSPGTPHHFSVEAVDAVGNVATDDRQGACHTFHTSSVVCIFADDVEPEPAPGWTHRADQGPDDWAPAVFRGARSPSRTWHAEGFDGFKDAFLQTPPLDIAPGDRFTFWHTFQLEKGYDGAVLEISTDSGATWRDLGPYLRRGEYSEVVTGSTLGERLAWTGRRDDTMSAVEVDLSAWTGPARRIRFRLGTDASTADGFGWHIDDVGLCRALNKRAAITLDREVYRCDDTLDVRVRDLDLVGAGTLDVSITSTSHPQPRAFTLAETDAAGGIFALAVPLGAAAGAFAAADGDEIVISYVDGDDGTAGGATVRSVAAAVDCTAPAIAGVRIVELFDDEAVLAWETDEPAISEALAGPSCDNLPLRVTSPLGGTSHVITLAGLDTGVDYRFKIQARDRAGNTRADDVAGVCRSFRPAAVCVERWDFDQGAPGWLHTAAVGSSAWNLAASDLARTPPAAWSSPGAEELSDTALYSPFFVVPPGSSLAFWHSYEFEPSFDGGVIEISTDGGSTWADLGPQIRRGPYTATLVPPNPLAGRRAWSGGSLGPMERVVADLQPWADARAMVRFRAVSDASVGGAGWIIDRVEICQGVREAGRIAFDKKSYGCSGQLTVQVFDTGRIGASDAVCEISSSSDLIPRQVSLVGSLPGSGVFTGRIELVAAAAAGKLLVKEGDAVRATYLDPDDATGAAREVQAIAAVDCTPPAISQVRFEDVRSESAVVAFLTSESASVTVRLGTGCATLAEETAGARPGKEHRVRLDGLTLGTTYFAQIRATDEAGNSAVEPAAGCRSFRTRVKYWVFADTLEPGPAARWDDAARWRIVESDLAASATHAWTVSGDGRPTDAALTLPLLRAPPRSELELWHAFELPAGIAGGVIEGSADGGRTWIDLDAGILEGRYTSFMLPGSALEGRRAWTGGRLGPMTRIRVRLDDLAAEDVLVRLRWSSQGSVDEGSWLADDFRITGDVGADAFVGFDSPLYTCGGVVTVRLADSGLVGRQAQQVLVSSTSQSQPIAVELAEVAPGFFEGRVNLSVTPQLDSLWAVEGDQVRADFADLAGEDGNPRAAVAVARIDCTAPEVSGLEFGDASVSAARIRWRTREPAFGRVLHGADCDALAAVAASRGAGEVHEVEIHGLQVGAAAAFDVECRDLAGNASRTGDCARFAIATACGFEDPLEPPRAGWDHGSDLGPDTWQLAEFPRSHSPTRSFHGANTGQPIDAWLEMPPVDLTTGAVLSFWHTFSLEEGFDGAVLEISTDDGASWQSLGADIVLGHYTGTIATARGPMAGWTGGDVEDMRLVQVALGRHAGPSRRIRFRLLCDDSVDTPGWYIDDVSVCAYFAQPAGSRFTRGNCNSDALVNLSDAIFLLNHLFLGGAQPGCRRACDNDSNDALNITDAVYLLAFLFQGGRPLAGPLGCDFDFSAGELECGEPACLAE